MNRKNIDDFIEESKNNLKNVRFSELIRIAEYFFGKPRQRGTSHVIFKRPWPGDPRVNVQEDNSGKAKVYQVKQVLAAIAKIKELEEYDKP